MKQQEAWEKIAGILNQLDKKEEVLVTGINIVSAYMEDEDIQEMTLKSKDRKITVTLGSVSDDDVEINQNFMVH